MRWTGYWRHNLISVMHKLMFVIDVLVNGFASHYNELNHDFNSSIFFVNATYIETIHTSSDFDLPFEPNN